MSAEALDWLTERLWESLLGSIISMLGTQLMELVSVFIHEGRVVPFTLRLQE